MFQAFFARCVFRSADSCSLLPGLFSTTDESYEDDSGIRRSDVVNWYLKTIEKDIETEEELAEKKTILDKVLDRLISFDNVILALKEWGVSEEDYVPSEEDDPFLVVHPNVVVDDL